MTTPAIRAPLERLIAVADCAAEAANIGIMDEAIAAARAALAEQPVEAIPLDSQLPGPEDVNEDGYCWLWDNYQRIWDWTYIRTRTKAEMYDYTHWLPVNAIPLPTND